MPGKGKGKSRGKSRGKRKKSERLEWKISYKISPALLRSTGATPFQLRRQALLHFQATRRQMPGVHIVVKWRNPDNTNPRHSNWKSTEDANQELRGFPDALTAAFGTLHGSLEEALSIEPEETRERKERRPVQIPTATRSERMKTYHAEVREIRAQHPSWRLEKARAEYRKRKAKKR
jgi:hypothetical protein